jgi:hypothetical protein
MCDYSIGAEFCFSEYVVQFVLYSLYIVIVQLDSMCACSFLVSVVGGSGAKDFAIVL